jgi:hypothetical protein
MTGNEDVAKKAGLPVGGKVRGIVILIQEDRFRLEDEQGRGYLFTLGWEAGASTADLYVWSGQKTPVTVECRGAPDLGAVALKVFP